MHVPHAFQIDRAASLKFALERGFGLACATDGDKPVASPVPFHLSYGQDGTPVVAFHVARHNPLASLADGEKPWLLAVQGDDAYVSSDWYASAHQVPTWLYQAVHLLGPVRPMVGDELVSHLDSLSERFERELLPKPIWTMAKVPAARREGLMRAIVGLVMTVDDVHGSFKLNQHKSDADHVAVTTALGLQPSPGAQAIAKNMRTIRPHAFAESTALHNIGETGAPGLVEETM